MRRSKNEKFGFGNVKIEIKEKISWKYWKYDFTDKRKKFPAESNRGIESTFEDILKTISKLFWIISIIKNE